LETLGEGASPELKFRLFSASSIWKDTFRKLETAASESEEPFSLLKRKSRDSERLRTSSFEIEPVFSESYRAKNTRASSVRAAIRERGKDDTHCQFWRAGLP